MAKVFGPGEDTGHRCLLCENESGTFQRAGSSAFKVACKACGKFQITERAVYELDGLSRGDRSRLVGAVREANERQNRSDVKEDIVIRPDNITDYLANAPRQFDVPAKARKLLLAIARKSNVPGFEVKLAGNFDYPLAYALDYRELGYLNRYLEQMEWITIKAGSTLTLMPKGWEEVQRRPRIESAQGFVAMWFDPQMDDAYYNGIDPAITSCGYKSRRIDIKEFNEDIVFECMAEIRESRFLVVDLTGQNNGAYFEAGFARGLEIPVVWTCRKDDVENIQFDATHNKQIRWETPDDLRDALVKRIIATINRGPLKPEAADE